ncbi:MAG: hypothetical protein Q4G65_05390 [bacterium]|nr:hypothetical protein [bacterium]
MKFEQFFYGRGDKGYGILGASVPSCGLTDLVVQLCQMPGTPVVVSDADDKPFLLQRVIGQDVLMACGCSGRSDGIGRGTSFFHVVVARLEDVTNFKMSAATLYENGVFASSYTLGSPVENLVIDPNGLKRKERRASRLEMPAVVLCRRSENLDILDLVGDDLVARDFATISWNVINEFPLYGLADSIGIGKIPESFNVYDSKGRILRAHGRQRTREGDAAGRVNDRCGGKNVIVARTGVLPLIMTGLVCWLIGACVGCLLNRSRPMKNEIASQNMVSQVEMNIALESREKRIKVLEDEIARLKRKQPQELRFEELYRIKSIAEIKGHKYYLPAHRAADQGDVNARAALRLYDKMVKYVEFVERICPATKNQKGQ